MDIVFDEGISDRFEAMLIKARDALDLQTPELESAANAARQDAAGNYVNAFELMHMMEHDDRIALKNALDDLAKDVATAKKLALAERARQAEVDAYNKVAETAPVDGETHELPTARPDFAVPVPPTITGHVFIREVPRRVVVTGQSKSSARPELLREYVRCLRTQSGLLAPTRGDYGTLEFELRTVWGEYLDNCSWVFLDAETVRTALLRLVEERSQSADWLENIADAFEKAGGHDGPNGAMLMSDGMADAAGARAINAQVANDILMDPNSTQEQMIEAIKIVEGRTDLLSDEARRRVGDVVGTAVKDQDITDVTVDLMGLMGADPVYSHQLFTNVTPDQFADAIRGLYADTSTVVSTGINGEQTPAVKAAEAQRYLDFLTAAGAAVGTYSKGTGELAPPPGLSDAWFNAMIDPNNPENASALSLMIDKGGQVASYDPAFLAALTDQIYNHDLANPDWWGDLAKHGAVSDITVNDGDPDNPNDSIFETPGSDPLANLLGGMRNTPVAAEQFFDDDDTVKLGDYIVNEKLHHLMLERPWPTDQGDGLGIAIEGATTHSRVPPEGTPLVTDPVNGRLSLDTAASRASVIASQVIFLNANGSRSGDWHLPPAMADSMGVMLASYAPDVIDIGSSLSDGNTPNPDAWQQFVGPSYVHGQPLSFSASQDDLRALLREMGRPEDKTGLQYAMAGILNEQMARDEEIIRNAAANTNGSPNMGLLDQPPYNQQRTELAIDVGKAMAFVMGNGVMGGHDAEAIEQDKRDIMAGAYEISIGAIPVPGGPARIITDIMGAAQADQIRDTPSSVTDKFKGDTNQVVEKALSRHSWDILIRQGFLPVGGPDGVPADAVIGEGAERRIDPNAWIKPTDINSPTYEADKLRYDRLMDWETNGIPKNISQPTFSHYKTANR